MRCEVVMATRGRRDEEGLLLYVCLSRSELWCRCSGD